MSAVGRSVPGEGRDGVLSARSAVAERAGPSGRYRVDHHENYHADGARCGDSDCVDAWLRGGGRRHVPLLTWSDFVDNLVTTAGKNKYLDATLKTGLAAPAWFLGLVGGAAAGNTLDAGDTLPSHGGWSEEANYAGARKAWTPGTIARDGGWSGAR